MGVTMPTTVFKNIKGKKLLPDLVKKLKAEPDKIFTVTIEEIQTLEIEDDLPMPPEKMISEKLIKKVGESENDIKAGRYTECKTNEEIDVFFQKILNEN